MGFAPTFYFGLKPMQNAPIEERVKEIAARAAKAGGVEFVHCEISGVKRSMTVRVYIDKPGGVTVDDCAEVSRTVEESLDSDDLISSAYVLEVSSPGLERELYSLQDFAKFSGQKAKVKLASAVNGQKVFVGEILGVDGEDILLRERTNGEIRFPHADVLKANLRVDLEQEFKKR